MQRYTGGTRGARRPRVVVAVAVLALAAAGCRGESAGLDAGAALRSRGEPRMEAPPQGILRGAASPVGNGVARSYVVVEGGTVMEVGVALSERALHGLPGLDHGEPHGDPHGEPGRGHAGSLEILLPMHPRNPTPYRFVELNWNPSGHEPPGLYDLPHFDVHFYTISVAERNAIDPADPEYAAKAGRFPDPAEVPAGFLPFSTLAGAPPEAVTVPRMGMHWVHPESPEFRGEGFSNTMLYGTWDGAMIFAEPMVTLDFLRGSPDVTTALPLPERGYAPEAWRVYRDPVTREVRIALVRPAVR